MDTVTDESAGQGVLARLRRAVNPHHHPDLHPSASFSATMRVRLENHPGAFAGLAEAIGDAGGLLGAIDLVRVGRGHKVRDVTFLAADAAHVERILTTVREAQGVEIEHVSDRTFLAHLGGKLEVTPRTPLKTRDDLSIAYTPGVGRICSAIAEDPAKVWSLTIKQNTVAVVTDGTAVLGLGDIGPEAALPVMEGKAVLFKEFGGIDAWPVCLATKDVDEIVRTVTALAPVFGGINLEDISAPRCFEIERRLRETLDIPVFHDDQHGTAIVVLAALLNALRVVGKRAEDVRVVVTGVGAAGTAVSTSLMAAGVRDLVGCDRAGAIYRGRPDLTAVKAEFAAVTNPRDVRGSGSRPMWPASSGEPQPFPSAGGRVQPRGRCARSQVVARSRREWDNPTMVVTLDAKRRLTVPTALAPAKPGDYFDAHFDADEDAIVFRRLGGRENWLAVMKECPVSPDDVPPRRRQLSKRRKL